MVEAPFYKYLTLEQ